jgi:hypothetical protein
MLVIIGLRTGKLLAGSETFSERTLQKDMSMGEQPCILANLMRILPS